MKLKLPHILKISTNGNADKSLPPLSPAANK